MHIRDFTRPDGVVVSIHYRYSGGSPDTYSPIYGADGGDPPEVDVEKVYVSDGSTVPDDELERYVDAIYADPTEIDYE